MKQRDLRMRLRPRWGAALAVLIIHVGLILALIHAFAPQFAASVAADVTQAFSIALTPAETVPPAPAPRPASATGSLEATGAAGMAGPKAKPRDAAVPATRLAVNPIDAPPVSGSGDEAASGVRAKGEGTGASGAGGGTGAGMAGTGQGGGGQQTLLVKIGGDINSAKDYPRASRDLRIGSSVTIDLTVGTDGRVKACRIVMPSPDPEADRITCDLAVQRFRFRPATDPDGHPVNATYRWRQRWFY